MEEERDKIDYQTSLDSLLVDVVKQAQSDGLISREESELINKIRVSAREFEAEVVKAREEESGRSFNEIYTIARKRMIESATETAKQDGVITADEEAIINRLTEALDKMKQ